MIMSELRYTPKQLQNPAKAIREMCIECVGGKIGSWSEDIKDCTTKACSLFKHRMGKFIK
jgi:hypothetical protein